ncbi:MAG: molybdopterin-dependent oxidoreductase [Verrucomicrobiaceae bacterium]|nr:molybdopterin-dependent oxidoreductase [Verrucomicrobiaceae bacterium]
MSAYRSNHSMISRRHFVKQTVSAAGLIAGGAAIAEDATVTMPFENGERRLVKYPQKRPLIVLTSRPPQLETPFSVFNDGVFTPNDAFFVRYHLANIPLSIDPAAYRLDVKGLVDKPLKLSLAELKSQFEHVEVAAVNQCSGNSRGFFKPRVGGGQLGNGAMGNAKWKGVRLKDVLDKAGVQATAKQVVCNGLDAAVLPQTPDFVKALEIDHARDGEIVIAFEMNGEPLPMLNGFPLRLVVPGYFGTYWVKHLNELEVVGDTFAGFYMATGYRIPATPGGCVEPGVTPTSTVPITRFKIRSFLTSLEDGAKIKSGRETLLRGIAFDGGHGITEVLVSTDEGKSWQPARLGKDHGKYSFREWTLAWTPKAGAHSIQCRAFNRLGESQPLEPLWNPNGYMRNVVETVKVTAA